MTIEKFSPTDTAILSRYFTNTDSDVFALINLPEVVKGALFARYSRYPGSLRQLFLKEFIEDGDTAVSEIASQLPGDDPIVNLKRAERLYDRVFSEFGDDSVAQLGGAHIACENGSNLLTKALEWGRLASYLEQSTRYIFYDQLVGERYRYYVPQELRRASLTARYRKEMNKLFEAYSAIVAALVPFYEDLTPHNPDEKQYVRKATIRAKACDIARGLLPAATESNVGIYASGQAYENALLRMQMHPLREVQECANLMLAELRKVIPDFLKRVDQAERGIAWSGYLADNARRMRELGIHVETEEESQNKVTLLDWDPEAELKVATAALFAESSASELVIRDKVRQLSDAERAEIIRAYVGDRKNRRHKPGRGMERVAYRFEIECDYGSFRDLQRHRLLTIEWQRISTGLGYVVPKVLSSVGLEEFWQETMHQAAQFHNEMEDALGEDVAQYAVPFAYRIRFVMQLSAREAFHMLELRTGQGGHASYREVCQDMHRLIKEQAGHKAIADAMSFVDYDQYELERFEAERRASAKREKAGLSDPLVADVESRQMKLPMR